MTTTTVEGIPIVGLAGSTPGYVVTASSPETGLERALANERAVVLAPSLDMVRWGAPIVFGEDWQSVQAMSRHWPRLDFSHLPTTNGAPTPCVQVKSGVSVARPELRHIRLDCGGVAAAPYLFFDTAPDVEGPDLMPVANDVLITNPARRMYIGGKMMGGGREFEAIGIRIEGTKDPENVAFEAASSDGQIRGLHIQGGRVLLEKASLISSDCKAYGYRNGPAFSYGSYADSRGNYAQDGGGNGHRIVGNDSYVEAFADSVGIGKAGADAQSCAFEVLGARNTVRGRVEMRAGRGGLWVDAHGTMHWITYGPNAHDCHTDLDVGDAVTPFVSCILGNLPTTGRHQFTGTTAPR